MDVYEEKTLILEEIFNGQFAIISKGCLVLTKALVLINVEAGHEEETLRELRKIEGVEEAYLSYGAYDIVARVRADTMEDLKIVITRRLRRLREVRSTLTLILIE